MRNCRSPIQKTNMKKDKLGEHADLILDLLRLGDTITAIWGKLKGRGVSVAYETVRKWVAAHADGGEGAFQIMKPGRPKGDKPVSLGFLPDHPITGPCPVPVYLTPLVNQCRSNWILAATCAEQTMQALGVPFDSGIPRPDWILPARRLAKLTDLELLLVVYVLSDIESPPLDKIFKDFSDWLNKLIGPASRLKASILKGTDIRVRDLFPASPGGAQICPPLPPHPPIRPRHDHPRDPRQHRKT